MQIIVQKFGGTSVASPEIRQCVVLKIQQALRQGYSPVVVVSAMGRKGAPYATDTLLSLLKDIHENTAKREADHLMYCGEMISAVVMAATLQRENIPAAMLTGGQAGIITDHHFGSARILRIEPSRILNLLQQGIVPVVCGFQGITEDGDFTTLGRGGSDTTGAALGAALNAEKVEIYTDVEGIMTADPRIVGNAKILNRIGYQEVCQLAHQGAKVIHPRAVEIAMQKNIPLVVKSTFSDAPGTLITSECEDGLRDSLVTDRIATGVTYVDHVAQIKIHVDSSAPKHLAYDAFRMMAESDISVDLINVHPGQIMFTVHDNSAALALQKLSDAGYESYLLPHCAKVSVIGGGMREVPGVMASFVEALTTKGIEILQTVDSHTSISALIPRDDLNKAVCSLHEYFHLAH